MADVMRDDWLEVVAMDETEVTVEIDWATFTGWPREIHLTAQGDDADLNREATVLHVLTPEKARELGAFLIKTADTFDRFRALPAPPHEQHDGHDS